MGVEGRFTEHQGKYTLLNCALLLFMFQVDISALAHERGYYLVIKVLVCSYEISGHFLRVILSMT